MAATNETCFDEVHAEKRRRLLKKQFNKENPDEVNPKIVYNATAEIPICRPPPPKPKDRFESVLIDAVMEVDDAEFLQRSFESLISDKVLAIPKGVLRKEYDTVDVKFTPDYVKWATAANLPLMMQKIVDIVSATENEFTKVHEKFILLIMYRGGSIIEPGVLALSRKRKRSTRFPDPRGGDSEVYHSKISCGDKDYPLNRIVRMLAEDLAVHEDMPPATMGSKRKLWHNVQQFFQTSVAVRILARMTSWKR